MSSAGRKSARSTLRPKPSKRKTRRAKREASAARETFLIVGIGASAGGLEAFKVFLKHMPQDTGMAFVLVQHLDPNRASMLVELLGPHSDMPVIIAAHGTRVRPNTVYVIPPNADLTIANGVLKLAKPVALRGLRRPIDMFFTSLAEDQGERAVCVILSGAGSDGSEGLRAIKEHGGLSLAQADFDSHALVGMPSSAAATGLVDDVIPVEDMPKRLIDYAKHHGRIKSPVESNGARQDVAGSVPRICALVRRTLGHDFAEYKPSTLIRRIQRRMQMRQMVSATEYIAYLEKEPREIELLFREFLISVTDFFRDPAAFEELGSLLKNVLKKRTAEEPIRVWVPACATGEEAFSIGILLKEAMPKRKTAPKVQIFATDIDEHAVAAARAARYAASRLAHVSKERLERWFVKEGEYYYPIKEIREMCIFSTHSVGKDPPFSKLDLISCRNLLIYFDSQLQDRVIRTFHYALRRDGYLFTGISEGIGRLSRLFTPASRKHRIYQRRDIGLTEIPRLPAFRDLPAAEPSPPAVTARAETDIEKSARRAMEKHLPAYVVISKDHEVLRFSGETDWFLGPAPGAATLNLFSLLRKSLRPAARAALQKVSSTGQPVTQENVLLQIAGRRRFVDLIVEPVTDGLYALGFVEHGIEAGHQGPSDTSSSTEALERELRETRERLQTAIDALETGNEELKSSNEEYQSVNEELQSANEELETAKEEMQSLNEELQTVNAELSSRNEQLVQMNSDLVNLKNSTQIATIFIDGDMQIRDFTPAMTELFHLRDVDRGRPVMDIANRLSYSTIAGDIERVTRTLSVVERELVLEDRNAVFLMRVWPYRTVDNKIDGVTITFVDLTERKRDEQLRAALAAIVDSALDPIIATTPDGTITSWNKAAVNLFGFSANDMIGKSLMLLIPPDRAADEAKILARSRRGDRIDHRDTVFLRKDGRPLHVALTVSPISDSGGRVVGVSVIARDITERQERESERKALLEELNHRIKNTLAVVQSIARQTLGNEARAAFEPRLRALSHVHDLLVGANWKGASIREIAESALKPFAKPGLGKYVLSGRDDLRVKPNETALVMMTLHELATNAAKYGALSTPGGQVHVKWQSAGNAGHEKLTLSWDESMGPPVVPPTSKGFGTKMIESGWGKAGGAVHLTYAPEGLKCRLELKLS